MQILDYCTKGGKNLITDFINSLPQKEQLYIKELREELSCGTPLTLSKFNTRQLRGKIWEIKHSNIRIFYILIDDDHIIFLNICKKQKNRTELFELTKAIQRAKSEKLL